MADENLVDSGERRGRQRFLAKWRGEYCFWVVIAGERRPLLDLSMEGFAIQASSPPESGQSFDFVMQHANVPNEICGTARVVNYLSGPAGGQAGCLFVSLEPNGLARLEDWLTTHVLLNASVPITEKEAAKIVSGRSLI